MEYPNGSSKKYNRFSILSPKIYDGSTIIVGTKEESEPFDVTEFFSKELASILSDFVQSITFISYCLEDNNIKMKDSESQIPIEMNVMQDDFISLSEILIIFLSKNIKQIFISIFLFLLISIFYLYFFTKPVHTSYSKLMDSGQDGSSQAAGLAAQFGITLPTNETEQKWVYSEVLSSREIS